ncbi:MAG: response regulator transcription factor [Acidobacteria bacterium]|nr:response regulator transcription factor [Acidobacteriota bacterium]
MKVIVVDDHRIVREGICMLLGREADVELVGEASSGQELLTLLETTDCDVVLLDVRMPDKSGLEVLEELQERKFRPRVIVLSMHDDPSYVRRAIELGASGYLLKSVGKEELLRALGVVAAGGSYIQGEITAPLIARMVDPSSSGPIGALSLADIDMLQMLAEGLDNRAIAQRLGVSEAVVKAHLRSIYSHLEVKRRSEAVAVALRLGVIT